MGFENAADCIEVLGEHCWYDTGYRTASIPPQIGQKCKHCPATRAAIPREGYTYKYPDNRTWREEHGGAHHPRCYDHDEKGECKIAGPYGEVE